MAIEKVGRYEIVRMLGKGAMGVVYVARDPIIDREVALKTLRVDLDPSIAGEFRERFIREARAAGRLNHRSIVTVHDVGEDPQSGLVFIAMEYIRGQNLKDILASGHKFNHIEAAHIVHALAQALDYAHSMGVVHRDIKPANIILTADGIPKITDFGVARLESSNLTVEGQFIGTPNYMSPEQILGRPVDGRSDLFSLGVVLFELLTHIRPFAGNTMHEVTHKIVDEPCPIPSAQLAGLPAAFNPIVMKCLEKEPDKRFQKGVELATVLAALTRALTQRPAAGRPATGPIARPAAAAPVAADEPTVAASARAAARAPARPAAPGLIDRLPLPEFFRWEVQPSWVLRIVAVWVLLWIAGLTLLYTRRDEGPFPAPSSASIRNLRSIVVNLQRCRALIERGDDDAAVEAGLRAIDQAPGSPAARRLIAEARRRLSQASSDGETQLRVEELVTEGRRLYGRGNYSLAAELFQEALSLDPSSELALSYLELAEERLLTQPQATNLGSSTSPRPQTRRSQAALSLDRATLAEPETGTVRITVFFESPINAGSLVVTLDGDTLGHIPFDFTGKGMLGIKRKGSGKVKRVLVAPSGKHTIGVQLTDAERGPIGVSSFNQDMPAGTDWTLRVDLPKDAAEAAFYLVKSSG